MSREDIALACLSKKFNCAQSVFYAFAEDVGMDKKMALRVASCFGGGMRCGEVCGAVSGVLMAIGMKYGSSEENDETGQYLAYKKEKEFINSFKEKHETILCRELLGFEASEPEDMQRVVQQGLHITVCTKAIVSAIRIAEELL